MGLLCIFVLVGLLCDGLCAGGIFEGVWWLTDLPWFWCVSRQWEIWSGNFWNWKKPFLVKKIVKGRQRVLAKVNVKNPHSLSISLYCLKMQLWTFCPWGNRIEFALTFPLNSENSLIRRRRNYPQGFVLFENLNALFRAGRLMA